MRELHHIISIAIIFCMLSVIFASVQSNPTEGNTFKFNETPIREKYQEQQIHSGYFTENLGQWDQRIQFSCSTDFGSTIFKQEGLTYNIAEEKGAINILFNNGRDPIIFGQDEMSFPSNFFLGDDPEGWVTGAKSYRKIVYEDVWSGIDIEYYFKGQFLKYDIIVHPGADPEKIRFDVTGHKGLVMINGDLSIRSSDLLSINDGKLVALSDERSDIPAEFRRIGSSSYGFKIEKKPTETLVIDPLVYSSSMNGNQTFYPADFTLDEQGCRYIFGQAWSPDVPVTNGSYNTNYSGGDQYVMKLDRNGSQIVFATFIGGWSGDLAHAIRVDEFNDIYLCGRTYGLNFPTTAGVIQENHNSVSDITLVKLNSSGDKLIYSTFLGGDFPDIAWDMEVLDGNIYIAGYSLSHDLPSKDGPIGGVHGIAFFSIINHNATAFLDSMMWDGYHGDFPTSLDVSPDGQVVIGGYSGSSDFPFTPHSFQHSTNSLESHGWIVRYDPMGNGTLFSSLVGACAVMDVKFDENMDIIYSGRVGLSPYTSPPSFPVSNVNYSKNFKGWNDVFVGKILGDGSELEWLTVVGGSENETGAEIHLDELGNIYLFGTTGSNDLYTTEGCYNNTLQGDKDTFFFKMNGNGTKILFSSYFGTNGTEEYMSSLVREMNDLTILGTTTSDSIPVTNGAYRSSNRTAGGIFLSTFTIRTIPSPPRDLIAKEGEGNISLSWTPPIDIGNGPIINYSIYRGPDPFNLTYYTTSENGTTFNDIDVDFGIEYHYGVAAINAIGEGFQSNSAWNISCTLADPPSKISAEVGIYGVMISFEPPEFTGGLDITNYHLYRDSILFTTLDPDDTEHVDSDVGLGEDHTYNLTTENRKGESDLGKGITIRTKDLPSAPVNFNAIVHSGKVDLRWEEPDHFGGLEIESYMIYKGNDQYSMIPIRSLEPDTLSFRDTFVYIGDEYFYSISALNRIGESERSPIVSVIPYDRPSKPFDIDADPMIGQINVSWSPPEYMGGDDDISYRLYHGTSGGSAGLLVVLTKDQLHYQHSVISDGIKHYYFVTATNMMGESEQSDTVYASSLLLPFPPLNITAEPDEYSIKINWEKPQNIGIQPVLEYSIYRRTDSTDPEKIAVIDPGVKTFLDKHLDRKTRYFYSLRTVMETGSSPKSDEVSAIVLSNPDPPQNVKVVSTGVGLDISWDPPQFNGGYEITWYSIFRTDPSGITVSLRNVDPNITSYNDNSVDNGFIYTYFVKALNDAGPSEMSLGASCRVMDIPLPPEIVEVEIVSDNIVIRWSPNSSVVEDIITGYNIYRSSSTEQVKIISKLNGHTRIHIDKDVVPGEIYEYYITAENEAGESELSVKVTIDLEIVEEERDPGSMNILAWTMAGILGVIILLIVFIASVRKREEEHVDLTPWEEE